MGKFDAADRRSSTQSSSLIALLALSACGARRVRAARHAPIPPPSPSPVALLQKDLGAIFEAPQFERSFWSVLVRTAATNEALYALNSGEARHARVQHEDPDARRGCRSPWLGLPLRDQNSWRLAPVESGRAARRSLHRGQRRSDHQRTQRRARHPARAGAAAARGGIRKIDGRIIGDDDAFRRSADSETGGRGTTCRTAIRRRSRRSNTTKARSIS